MGHRNKLTGEKIFHSLHCCFAPPFQPHTTASPGFVLLLKPSPALGMSVPWGHSQALQVLPTAQDLMSAPRAISPQQGQSPALQCSALLWILMSQAYPWAHILDSLQGKAQCTGLPWRPLAAPWLNGGTGLGCLAPPCHSFTGSPPAPDKTFAVVRAFIPLSPQQQSTRKYSPEKNPFAAYAVIWCPDQHSPQRRLFSWIINI